MKHLVICRTATKQRNYRKIFKKISPLANSENDKWEHLLSRYMFRNEIFTKNTLSNQTNQNFELLCLIDKDIDESIFYPLLTNQALIKIDPFLENKYISTYINSFVKITYPNEKEFIITRLDNDDLLRKDFIQNLQDLISINKYPFDTCIDVNERKYLCLKSKNIYLRKERFKKLRTSCFISSYETTDDNNNLKLIPYSQKHHVLPLKYNIIHTDKLDAIATVDGLNVMNDKKLDIIKTENTMPINDIDLKHYGININSDLTWC